MPRSHLQAQRRPLPRAPLCAQECGAGLGLGCSLPSKLDLSHPSVCLSITYLEILTILIMATHLSSPPNSPQYLYCWLLLRVIIPWKVTLCVCLLSAPLSSSSHHPSLHQLPKSQGFLLGLLSLCCLEQQLVHKRHPNDFSVLGVIITNVLFSVRSSTFLEECAQLQVRQGKGRNNSYLYYKADKRASANTKLTGRVCHSLGTQKLYYYNFILVLHLCGELDVNYSKTPWWNMLSFLTVIC